MTTPNPTPNPTPGSPTSEPESGASAATSPSARGGRLRHRWLLGLGAVLAIVAVALLVLRTHPGQPAPPTPPSAPVVDRTNPGAVGSAFLARYAAHDPTVCDLATPTYRTTLDRAERCAGHASVPTPHVSALFGPIICGDRAGLAAQVSPPGQVGTAYAFVVLEATAGTWTVRSLLPLADRSMISSYACDTPSPDDGG